MVDYVIDWSVGEKGGGAVWWQYFVPRELVEASQLRGSRFPITYSSSSPSSNRYASAALCFFAQGVSETNLPLTAVFGYLLQTFDAPTIYTTTYAQRPSPPRSSTCPRCRCPSSPAAAAPPA